MPRTTVAALRVNPDDVLAEIERLCELSGLARSLDPQVPTVLKDDMGPRFPFPGAHTTPWQLEGAVRALRKLGVEEISYWSDSRPLALLPSATAPHRYENLLDSLAVTRLHLGFEQPGKLREYRPKAQLRVLHQLFPEGIWIPEHLFGRNVIHLPVIRYSRQTLIAGALLSASRGLLGNGLDYAGSWFQVALVDLLAIQREVHPSCFAVVDGTTAGGTTGWTMTTAIAKDVMIAGADPVAVDAVVAKLAGFDPMKMGFIRLAHEEHLGVGDPRDITLVGDDISQENWGLAAALAETRAPREQIPRGHPTRLEALLLRPAVVKTITRGSDLFQEARRWNRRERAIFDRWKHGTPWGALFDAYSRGEQFIGRARVQRPSEP